MRKMNLVGRDDSFSVDKRQHSVGIGSGKGMTIHIYSRKNITIADRVTV
jgi:hypothetical protein